MRKTQTVQHAVVAAAALLAAFMATGCGGADPGTFTGSSAAVKVEAGTQEGDSKGVPGEAGDPGEAGEAVDGGAAEPDAPPTQFGLCVITLSQDATGAETTSPAVPFVGCGDGWAQYLGQSGIPALQKTAIESLRSYVVTYGPGPGGETTACDSGAPPVPVGEGVCPPSGEAVSCEVVSEQNGVVVWAGWGFCQER
jgi:hypothetical protein